MIDFDKTKRSRGAIPGTVLVSGMLFGERKRVSLDMTREMYVIV